MSSTISPWRSWTSVRALLVALFLCRGLVYLGVLPIFEGWDEYQHIGYVVHLVETGQPATLGQTSVPRSLLRELVKYPVPRRVAALQLGHLGAVDYDSYWSGVRSPALRSGSLPLYESQHSWWYYRLVAPLFLSLGGVANLPAAVGGLRLLNLGFVATAVWVATGVVGRVVRNPRDAIVIGLVIAVHPLFLLNGVRVANDALGVLLATVAISLSLSRQDTLSTLQRGALIGLVTGLASVVKAVNLGLLPFVALAWFLTASLDRDEPRRVIAGGVVLIVVLLGVVQGEFRSNLRRYGGPTPMQEAIRNRQEGRTLSDLIQTARSFRWDVRVRRLWLSESFLVGGWSRLRPGPVWGNAYTWLGVAGLLSALGAWAGGFKRTEPVLDSQRTALLCALLCLSFTMALAYHMVQSKLAWGEPTTCPWYASAAFPWFLLIVTAGGLSWPSRRLRLLIPLGLTATCLGAESVVIWSRMLPTYSGGATGLTALQRLASLQAPAFGTATLLVAEAGAILCTILLIGIALSNKSAPVAHPPLDDHASVRDQSLS